MGVLILLACILIVLLAIAGHVWAIRRTVEDLRRIWINVATLQARIATEQLTQAALVRATAAKVAAMPTTEQTQ